jgi:hypothetical protein
MTRFDLPANYHSDPESLIRKSRSRFSSPGSSRSHVRDIVDTFQGSPPPQEHAQMANRTCINDFSAPSSSNVRTGLETNVGDGSFKLKPALINMVQQSPFYGKSSEDANAHFQYFLEICSTFTIRRVTRDTVRLRLFPFIIRKGETMVLFQQGGSVNLGEMLECISRQIFSVGQDQCSSEKDLYLSTSQRCHISCDKFSSHTGNLNLWVWRRSSSQT